LSLRFTRFLARCGIFRFYMVCKRGCRGRDFTACGNAPRDMTCAASAFCTALRWLRTLALRATNKQHQTRRSPACWLRQRLALAEYR